MSENEIQSSEAVFTVATLNVIKHKWETRYVTALSTTV